MIHGRLLVGRRMRRLRGRGGAAGAPLWWPQGKVAGEHLPRWLAEHGIASAASTTPPDGVRVSQSLRAMRGAETQYLRDLAPLSDRRPVTA